MPTPGPDGLAKELGVGRAGVRASGRQLLGGLDLATHLDELLARDISPQSRELVALLVPDVLAQLRLEAPDQVRRAYQGGSWPRCDT